jgi:hypothetical protein
MPATLLAQAGKVFEARFFQPEGIGSPTAGWGHSRRFYDQRDEAGVPPTPDVLHQL